MKMFLKRSFWAMLTAYVALWLVVSLVAGVILEDFKNVINSSLGLTGYRTETITTEGEDLEYFKSKYVQYNEDGTIKYVTDENGYTHQVYDDAALREAAIAKAYQVQREGSTILWNNADNGLPLAEGNKVSLFSHSTVDWVYSGFGSGRSNTTGSKNMKDALKNAGLSVNETLWNFYKTGAGKDYVRDGRYAINEVPWSKYTDAVKSSFENFGDAAIIVLSRQTGEQSSSGDAALTGADTPSGSYYDLSSQELDMIREVIALKNAGTFKKVIVLLNTATDIWFDPLFDYKDDIDCCLWVSQTGQVGLDEVGNILAGKSIPSGHLPDTFLMNSNSNPAVVNFTPLIYTNANTIGIANAQWQSVYTIYMEGIYLGYKYFETRYEDAVMGRGNASSTAGAVNSESNWVYSEEVAFPFGYGAAYTEFQYSNYKVELNDDGNYNITVTVTNIGKANGQDAVQIYVQKPYTEYDKKHGVEQAAVNLAGYAKTPELKPGESVTVSIMVRDDALKTYDANNAKTYIREAGDYYFAVGHDAHDAINNILAAKGYTPDNTGGVMDAAGNSKMVEKISFAEDDFTTYSVSEQTGKPITNQFDNTDWNKYELKTEGTVTYLSRNDWEATYPTQLKLSLSKEMLEDLSWNKDVAVNPGDKMPLYGQSRVFNLIDLKGLPYDHASWDTLLNQMTLEEQIKLLAHCYHGTKEVISIAKPAEVTHDGPLGIRQKYKTNSSAYTMSFPNTVLLAASFNDDLAYEVGYLMGEDMLHVGVTGIYAPGANIHRSTYSGRNYEYYSEDGFLSGMMGKWQVIGIQETGCYVNMKHFALNDSESNRHGVGTWANEQSIREIYLAAFEYAVTEGDCTGIMSAFNRLGTLWCGAHKGLTTEVLRNEWGFEGFVISDCAWREYMGVVDGVMAGCDCILDDATEDAYYEAENNPTIALGIRESVHRILYVTANGNSMNGFSSNTKIYEVKEWWQVLVTDVQTGLAIATGILALITILAFIFLKDTASMISIPPILKIVETVVAIVIALAIGAGSVFITAKLPTLPNNFMAEFLGGDVEGGGETGGEEGGENSSLKDQLEGNLVDYIFEAECSDNELTSDNVGNESNIIATNHPSGGQYVHNMTKLEGVKFTFNVTSASAQKAVLSICMGQRDYAMKLSDMFTITVNGTAVEVSDSIEFKTYSGIKYFDWTEKEVVIVDLVEGNNVIELTQADHGGKFLNFDYIALTSAANLQWTKEVGVGHTYDVWEMTKAATLDEAGELHRYCSTCRLSDVVELPAISEANGYDKTVHSEPTATAFGSATWTYTKDGQTFTFDTKLYPEGTKEYQFEADKAKLTTQDTDGARRIMEVVSGATDSVYIGYVNKTSWTLKIQITSDKECEALFVLRMSRHNTTNYKFNDGRTLTVNGEKVSVSDDLVIEAVSSASAYYNWEDIEIAVIKLKEGKNVIELSNASGKAFNNIDYFELRSVAELAWYVVDDNHVHTEGVLPGTPATCLNGGTADGKYCTDCDEILVENVKIPALGHSFDGDTCTICNAVKFEAENVELINESAIPDKYASKVLGNEGKGAAGTNYPSGDAFVANLQHCPGLILRYEVTSANAQNAELTVRMGRRQYELPLSDWLIMTVNGKVVSFDSKAVFPVESSSSLRYYDWMELVAATISLNEGYNVIEFTVLEGNKGINFDYFTLNALSGGAISACCAANEHTYTTWSVDTNPTYEATGLISYTCDSCGKPMTVEIPKVSTENGYTLVSSGLKSVWRYTYEGKTFEFTVNDGIVLDVTAENDVFTSVVDNNGPNGNGVETNKKHNGYGIFYELTQGATFTLDVTSSEATQAVFVLKLCANAGTYNLQDVVKSISVGGVNVAVNSGEFVISKLDGTDTWMAANAVSVEFATLNLQKGKNTIAFTMGDINVNIAGVEIITFAEITHETVRHTFGNTILDYDPFIAENGGSTSGSTFKSTEAKYGTFYKSNQNSTFTFTVNVEKATDVVFYLNLAFNSKDAFYAKSNVVTSITSKNASGQANTVVIADGNIKNGSWTTNNAIRVELATISLNAGENTITFTFGNLDVNIASVFIVSDNEVVIGKK